MSNVNFRNVNKLNENEFMVLLTGQDLVDNWSQDKITYNANIQRGVKSVKDENGNEIVTPIYSASNVKKIKKCIENNNFYVSQLTLNVSSEDSVFQFDENEKTLSIMDGLLEILDGHHRLKALELIDQENRKENCKNFVDLSKLIFPVKITHYDESKAQQQFYQFTLGSKISSSRIEYFNSKDYSNLIVRDLYDDSVLTNRIENIKNIISKNEENHIVSFATLKNAIDLNFNTEKFESTEEAKDVSAFLKDYFSELFNIFPAFNSFEDRKLLKEQNSLMCENFTFYGYVAIAEYLMKDRKDNWKELLPLIKNIDLRKDVAPWISRVVKKNVTKKKDKETNTEIKVTKYSVINNNQSRKEMSTLLLKSFKKIERELNSSAEGEIAATVR